jgi:hypothetical protein
MSTLKTRPTDQDGSAFLTQIDNPHKRADSQALLELMQRVTGQPPVMWGDSIVGFGRYHYQYASDREGDWFLTGFSPRAQYLTLYIMSGFDPYDSLLTKLGKYKTGKSCLYIKRLSDIDLDILEALVRASVEHMPATNPVDTP